MPGRTRKLNMEVYELDAIEVSFDMEQHLEGMKCIMFLR